MNSLRSASYGMAPVGIALRRRHGFNRAYAFNARLEFGSFEAPLRPWNARHGSKLGRGVYFTSDPSYAWRFAPKTHRTRALLLAGVLPGRFTRGKAGKGYRGELAIESCCIALYMHGAL